MKKVMLVLCMIVLSAIAVCSSGCMTTGYVGVTEGIGPVVVYSDVWPPLYQPVYRNGGWYYGDVYYPSRPEVRRRVDVHIDVNRPYRGLAHQPQHHDVVRQYPGRSERFSHPQEVRPHQQSRQPIMQQRSPQRQSSPVIQRRAPSAPQRQMTPRQQAPQRQVPVIRQQSAPQRQMAPQRQSAPRYSAPAQRSAPQRQSAPMQRHRR